jgi:hypothetical protein
MSATSVEIRIGQQVVAPRGMAANWRRGVVGYVSRLVHRPEEIAGLAAGETRLESCPTARHSRGQQLSGDGSA